MRIVDIAKLVWFIEEKTYLSKVRSIVENAVLVLALRIHYVDRSWNNQINHISFLTLLYDNWFLRFVIPYMIEITVSALKFFKILWIDVVAVRDIVTAIVFVIGGIFVVEENILWVYEYFPLEVQLTVFKYCLELQIELIKHLV